MHIISIMLVLFTFLVNYLKRVLLVTTMPSMAFLMLDEAFFIRRARVSLNY